MSFINDLKIDLLALDQECTEQPVKYGEFAEAYAEAVFKRDKAKQNYKLKQAQCELNVRQNPEMFGLGKVTEASVQATVITDPEVVEAESLYLEAVRQFELVRAGRDSFADRREQLSNLVALYRGSYFASPTEIQTKEHLEALDKVL